MTSLAVSRFDVRRANVSNARDELMIAGIRPIAAKQNHTYPPGRICTHPDCTTPLTRYNPRPTCYTHTPPHYPRVRGIKQE